MKYKTFNPCTETKCSEVGCCLNCINYKGGTESIPTRICIICDAGNKNVVLPIHGYPEKDGVTIKHCGDWKGIIV